MVLVVIGAWKRFRRFLIERIEDFGFKLFGADPIIVEVWEVDSSELPLLPLLLLRVLLGIESFETSFSKLNDDGT